MLHGAPAPSREWCLFLDVDGTILEIAETPAAVVVERGITSLLQAAACSLGGALALVSGRSIETLDALFAPLKLPAAGQHGAERRGCTGDVVGSDAGAGGGSELNAARAQLRAFVDSHPGTLFEDKGRTVAVHFRQAPEHEAIARRAVRDAAAALEPRYHVQEGKMVLEIKSRGTTKGTAVEAFMQQPPFRQRIPVFVGDDLTDEPALRFVERAGGISVAVGGQITGQWHLENPREVRRWLAAIAALDGKPQGRS